MFEFNNKTKRIVALLIVVFFVLLAFSSVFMSYVNADTKSELNQKQQDLSSNKNEIKSKINDLNTEKEDVLAEKEQLDLQVTELEGEIAELDGQIDDYEEKISVVSDELEVVTKAADEQYDAFKKRVRVMYENGSTGYLDILLSSESFSDFFSRVEIVKQITAYDSSMTDRLREKQEEIQSKKDELEELKQGLLDSKTSLETKKSSLDGKMAKRDALIKQIESNVTELEKQLKVIEAEEASVRAQITKISGGNTSAYAGGSMTWPCPSCKIITSEYGWRLHPVLGYEKLHTGMDIGASYGAKIIAAKSGKVITATENRAYGKYVVIDHGGGICTLYAHQSSLAVSVGQSVNEGDTVGYVGSTGYSTGPHLHFEVIVNGQTTNPRNYVG